MLDMLKCHIVGNLMHWLNYISTYQPCVHFLGTWANSVDQDWTPQDVSVDQDLQL